MNIRTQQWWELKKMLKQRFSQLSDEDLIYENGKETELFLKLGQKTGRSEEDVARIIKGFLQAYLQHRLL